MRVRRVNRYYCDFCKKAGCSKYHLARHEQRCTNNPNRVCGMCKVMENTQPNLSSIIALLPNPDNFKSASDNNGGYEFLVGLDRAVAEVFWKVRSAAGNCPACILSALRQAKIPVPLAEGFDYDAESKAAIAEANKEPEEAYY